MQEQTATRDLERISQDQLDALVRLHNRFLDGRLGGRRATLKNTDISGLTLKGQNLKQANFMGCSMVSMDLSDANFQEASLYACDLSNSNLNNTKFIRADLRGARIESASMEGANLENADLRIGGITDGDGGYDGGTAVNFRGANLSGAKLAGSMASQADFSDAIMAGANMSGADLSNAQMEGADLSDAEIGGAKFGGANLKSAILIGVSLDDLHNARIDLNDAITDENIGRSVSELDDSLANLVESHKDWVASAGKNGNQLDLSGLDMRFLKTLKQEKLTAIKAVGAKFFGMNMYQVELQSAILDGADFRNCDLEESDLRGASFKGANLSHTKLRNANCSALMFGGGAAPSVSARVISVIPNCAIASSTAHS